MSTSQEDGSTASHRTSMLDLAALQGVWMQVAMEADGRIDAPDDVGGDGALTTIAGHRFVVRDADGTLLLKGSFTLDASVEPKSITWTDDIGPDAGKPLLASYVLDGDRFMFIAADTGQPRPLVFRTTLGLTMRRFVRTS